MSKNDKTPHRQPKLSVSIHRELLQRLDQVVAAHGPLATRHRVHVAALRLGLEQLEADPTCLLRVVGR